MENMKCDFCGVKIEDEFDHHVLDEDVDVCESCWEGCIK